VPDGSAGFVGESQATARRFCVFWGVGAQRVRVYDCTSTAPTSPIVPPRHFHVCHSSTVNVSGTRTRSRSSPPL
jgi:hypothetical protein